MNLRMNRLRAEHDRFLWMMKSAVYPKSVGYVLEVLTDGWQSAFGNEAYPEGTALVKWFELIRTQLLINGFHKIGVAVPQSLKDYLQEVMDTPDDEVAVGISMLERDPYFQYVAYQKVSVS